MCIEQIKSALSRELYHVKATWKDFDYIAGYKGFLGEIMDIILSYKDYDALDIALDHAEREEKVNYGTLGFWAGCSNGYNEGRQSGIVFVLGLLRGADGYY